MADPFSVAASACDLLGLRGELVRAEIKMTGLVDTDEFGQGAIVSLINDMHALREVLIQIPDPSAPAEFNDDATLEICQVICRNIKGNVRELLQKIVPVQKRPGGDGTHQEETQVTSQRGFFRRIKENARTAFSRGHKEIRPDKPVLPMDKLGRLGLQLKSAKHTVVIALELDARDAPRKEYQQLMDNYKGLRVTPGFFREFMRENREHRKRFTMRLRSLRKQQDKAQFVVSRLDEVTGTDLQSNEPSAVADNSRRTPKQRVYRSVRCLLWTWKDEDEDYIAEVRQLSNALFQRYDFLCETKFVSSRNSASKLIDKFNRISSEMRKNDLLVIYYSGHGQRCWKQGARRGTTPDLILFPTAENRPVDFLAETKDGTFLQVGKDFRETPPWQNPVNWNSVFTNTVLNMPCDIVLVLDTAHAELMASLLPELRERGLV